MYKLLNYPLLLATLNIHHFCNKLSANIYHIRQHSGKGKQRPDVGIVFWNFHSANASLLRLKWTRHRPERGTVSSPVPAAAQTCWAHLCATSRIWAKLCSAPSHSPPPQDRTIYAFLTCRTSCGIAWCLAAASSNWDNHTFIIKWRSYIKIKTWHKCYKLRIRTSYISLSFQEHGKATYSNSPGSLIIPHLRRLGINFLQKQFEDHGRASSIMGP